MSHRGQRRLLLRLALPLFALNAVTVMGGWVSAASAGDALGQMVDAMRLWCSFG